MNLKEKIITIISITLLILMTVCFIDGFIAIRNYEGASNYFEPPHVSIEYELQFVRDLVIIVLLLIIYTAIPNIEDSNNIRE
jgi:hypothetical protein